MKSLPKLIRRYVSILLLSCVLLLTLNIILLVIFFTNQHPNAHPYQTAQETADALKQSSEGRYMLSDSITYELKEDHVWAVLIEEESKQVTWHTDNLPDTIPHAYTLSDIADLTRGSIADYPAFTGTSRYGLIVLGYPKNSFWKHMWPSWDYDLIASLPKTVLIILAVNAAFIFLIYLVTNSRLLQSIKPIVSGIQSMPTGESVHLDTKGPLSELALNINKTSEILQAQNHQLHKKETARANWIAGVSHDIRTPLSMVMGYAAQLREDTHLTEDEQKKAEVIVKQSERMRSLISDLNLASKLEYNMQPIHAKQENLIAITRQVAVDFINMDVDEKYPIHWETDESLTLCPVNADAALLKRAVSNLIQNSITHNEQGCSIYICVTAEHENCTITVSDDGIGADDEQINKLNHAPHYMSCDENLPELQHGLGFLIVRQIIAAHGGTTIIDHSPYGGFYVKITLPKNASETVTVQSGIKISN